MAARDRLARLIIIGACLAGAGLRLVDVRGQVVEDDEIHAVLAAAGHDAAFLVTHHQPADYCIPMALWDRLLVRTIGLDELGLRVPVIVAGLLALWLFVSLCRRTLAPPAAAVAVLAAALSPLLIQYSRFARPYMIVVALVLACLLAQQRFAATRDWRWGLATAVCGGAAPFFLPFAAFTVAGVWGLAALRDLRQRRAGGLIIGAAGMALTALLFAPSLTSFLEQVRLKSGARPVPPSTLWQALRVLSGTGSLPPTLIVLAMALVGVRALWRRDRALAETVALTCTAQLIGLIALRPLGTAMPVVVARYAISALPLFLLAVGAGAGWIIEAPMWSAAGVETRDSPWPLALVAALVLLLPAARLRATFAWPNSFTSHRFFHFRETPPIDPALVPRIYETLRQRRPRGGGRVIEAPWTREWPHTFYGDYQRVHGWPVATLTWAGAQPTAGLRFDTLKFIDPMGATTDPAVASNDVLIVHKDITGEVYRLTHRLGAAYAAAEYRQAAALVLEWAAAPATGLRRIFDDADLAVFVPAGRARPVTDQKGVPPPMELGYNERP